MANDFRAPMPPRLSQDRGNAGGAGYQRAQVQRAGMRKEDQPRTGMEVNKNANLQPAPVKEPEFPAEENGFAPDVVSADSGHDAQDVATQADPIACETEPAEVIPTTAKPPEGEDVKTEPTIEGVENSPTGSVSEPRYPSLIEEAHVVGYPGKTAR